MQEIKLNGWIAEDEDGSSIFTALNQKKVMVALRAAG